MPGLGVAQDVAAPAQVKVAGADLEPRAQAVQRGEGLKPFQRARRDLGPFVREHHHLPAPVAAPHAPAQLVQLRQAKAVGAADDHGVGAGHVQPRLDDVGGQQHVAVAAGKADHRLVDLCRGQLAVDGDHAEVGDEVLQRRGHRVHVADAGHHDEALPPPRPFPQQRRAQHPGVVFGDRGADRLPPSRRGRDHRQLLQADQRRLQRARDRRRGQRQDVARRQRPQLALVGVAEPLFLVDHDKAEVLVFDPLARHRAGAHDHLHRPVGDPRQHRLAVRGRGQARQPADLDAKGGEAAGELLDMLAGQDGRRRRDRDLPPGQHRDGGGAQRDLGLAEAHVAHDQPVHRLARGEIVAHRLDRAGLIRGLAVREPGREAFIVGRVGVEHRRGPRLAFRRQPGQSRRRLGHRRLDPGAALAPARPVQPVQRHRLGLGPVAPDLVRLRHRNQPVGVVRIGQADRVARILDAFRGGQRLDASDDADPVFLVDDHVADGDVHRFQRRGPARAAGVVAPRAAAQQVRRRHGQHTVAAKPAPARHGERQDAARVSRHHLGPAFHRARVLPQNGRRAAGEEPQVALGPQQHHPLAIGHRGLGRLGKGPERRLAFHEARRRLAARRQRHDLAPGEPGLPVRLGQKPAPDVPLAPLDLVGERQHLRTPALGRAGQDDARVRQVVDQRRGIVGQRQFGQARDRDVGHVLDRALVDEVVAADLDDPAVLDLDPHRVLGLSGEDVHDLTL